MKRMHKVGDSMIESSSMVASTTNFNVFRFCRWQLVPIITFVIINIKTFNFVKHSDENTLWKYSANY